MKYFDNSDVPEYMPVKYIQNASKLSDKELLDELVSRGLVSKVYAEKTIPLKLTMYMPHEQKAIAAGYRQELAHGIGRKLLANHALRETTAVQPDYGTHMQVLELSAYVINQRIE